MFQVTFTFKAFYNFFSRFGLIVLNSPISQGDKVLQLWNKAKFRVLVDGGANRWNQVSINHYFKSRGGIHKVTL
jgi:hypothetical protein